MLWAAHVTASTSSGMMAWPTCCQTPIDLLPGCSRQMACNNYCMQVRFGRGWYIIRGVPVERYSQRESALAYWWDTSWPDSPI